MTNGYFNHTTPIVRHTRGRATNVNDVMSAVAAGFDLLPAPAVLREGRFNYLVDSGAANAYVVTFGTAPSGYSAGLSILMRAGNACTGASTINVNGLGAKSIKTFDGSTLTTGDIPVGIVHIVYDAVSGFFRIVGANGSAVAAAASSASSASTSASSASTSASTATTQAGIATTKAGEASTSAANAESSASTATTAQAAAETAESNAETAQAEAEAARDAAQTAETNAETAEANAETAETNAETAADAAAVSETNAAASAAKLQGTSASSVAIGTGSKSFTTQAGKFFDVGYHLLIVSAADPTKYMTGQVTAYSGTSLTVSVAATGGVAGTPSDWNIFVTGRPGDTGATGAQGAPGVGAGVGFSVCSVYRTANVTVPDVTLTAIDWTHESEDPSAMHDLVTNPSRITAPSWATRAEVIVTAGFAGSIGTGGYLAIYKSGSIVARVFPHAAAGAFTQMFESGNIAAVSGNYIELKVLQSSGGSLDLVGGQTELRMTVKFYGTP